MGQSLGTGSRNCDHVVVTLARSAKVGGKEVRIGAKGQGGIVGEDEWLRVACEANYSVARAAKLSGHSPRHFHRLFSGEMNRAPKEWFQEQRFARAMLEETGSVKAAALETGYTHTANFSRDFKKHHGISASELMDEP